EGIEPEPVRQSASVYYGMDCAFSHGGGEAGNESAPDGPSRGAPSFTLARPAANTAIPRNAGESRLIGPAVFRRPRMAATRTAARPDGRPDGAGPNLSRRSLCSQRSLE